MRFFLILLPCLAGNLGCRDGVKAQTAKALEGITEGEERAYGGDGGAIKFRSHRIAAESPIGEGWHRAVSTKGGFSVDLPLPFNDFRSRANAEDGVEVYVDAIGAKTAGLLAWTAYCISRADGTLGPADRKKPAAGEEVLGRPPKAHQRTIISSNRMCTAIVEAQGTDALPPESVRRRFLDSFTLTE